MKKGLTQRRGGAEGIRVPERAVDEFPFQRDVPLVDSFGFIEELVDPGWWREGLKVGDRVKVRVRTGNAAREAGDYEMEIAQSDDRSVAVNSFGPWWFSRDTGRAYVGDAEIVGGEEGSHGC